MTTRRNVFALILGAVAAAKLKPSPTWAGIMPPQPVAEVGVDDLLKQAWDEFHIRPDYVWIEYPIPLRSVRLGLYADEVLAHYPPRTPDDEDHASGDPSPARPA